MLLNKTALVALTNSMGNLGRGRSMPTDYNGAHAPQPLSSSFFNPAVRCPIRRTPKTLIKGDPGHQPYTAAESA